MKYLEEVKGNKNPQILFFGDNYLSDIAGIIGKKNWYPAVVN